MDRTVLGTQRAGQHNVVSIPLPSLRPATSNQPDLPDANATTALVALAARLTRATSGLVPESAVPIPVAGVTSKRAGSTDRCIAARALSTSCMRWEPVSS